MRERRALVAVTPIGRTAFEASLPTGLAERFTIHVVELPGTVDAAATPSVASTSDTIRTAVADLAPDGDAILFGHSMNGTLVLAAAAACAGVIAVCSPPALPPDPSVSAQYWELQAEPGRKERADAIVAAHEQASDDAERARQRERYDRLRRWYDTTFDPSELDRDVRIDFGWVQAIFDDAAHVDWPATMRAVECPVLLALGTYDFISPPTTWTPGSTPPRTTAEHFARSGHTPFVEQPDEFLDAVDRWLGAQIDVVK